MFSRSRRLLESTRSLLPLAVGALSVQHGGSSLRVPLQQGAPWLVAHLRCSAAACKEEEESVRQPSGGAALPSAAAAVAPAAVQQAKEAAAVLQQAEDKISGQASSGGNAGRGSAAGAPHLPPLVRTTHVVDALRADKEWVVENFGAGAAAACHAVAHALRALLNPWHELQRSFSRRVFRESFDEYEFLEGAKDAVWAVEKLIEDGQVDALERLVVPGALQAYKKRRDKLVKRGWEYKLRVSSVDAASLSSMPLSRASDAEVSKLLGRDAKSAAVGEAGGKSGWRWAIATVDVSATHSFEVSRASQLLGGRRITWRLLDERPLRWRFISGPTDLRAEIMGGGGKPDLPAWRVLDVKYFTPARKLPLATQDE